MQFRDAAAILDSMLRRKIVPYWLRTAPDVRYGGYRLDDRYLPPAAIVARALDGFRRLRSARGPGCSKQLVSQSRMLFAFSLAHRRGLDDSRGDCLAAAELGYRFLVGSMLDARYGGFVWLTDRLGRVVDARKVLYGQAFAIYGLVEYHRASGSRAPLELAHTVYQTVQSRLHDDRHGGWIELADERFELLPAGVAVTPPLAGHAGLKSGNAHLHWMEALTALYEVTLDPDVAASAAEALELNRTHFYPCDPIRCCHYRTPEWGFVTDTRYRGVSYGHNIEFAWLMVHTQRVLGAPAAWDHFEALLTHALQWGFDHARGGFFATGPADGPACGTQKVWWVQAEGLVALSEAVRLRTRPDYRQALEQLLDWIIDVQSLPADGIWLHTVDAKGRPVDRTKASQWKAAYHDMRAMMHFIERFA
jgi:mannobiose 2-epimerase